MFEHHSVKIGNVGWSGQRSRAAGRQPATL